jgi:hypothetical protein
MQHLSIRIGQQRGKGDTPDQPCSTTITPGSQNSTPTCKNVTAVQKSSVRAFTVDQAKSQIEAKGYSNVSGLRKDAKGIWRGKAVKDGLPINVTSMPMAKSSPTE